MAESNLKLHPKEDEALRLFRDAACWHKIGGVPNSKIVPHYEQHIRKLSDGTTFEIHYTTSGLVPSVQMPDNAKVSGSACRTCEDAKEQAWIIYRGLLLLGIMLKEKTQQEAT